MKKAASLKKAYIGIGSNLGDRLDNIKKAIALLNRHKNIKITQRSSIYETEPVGYKEQPDFLNSVVQLKTGLTPQRLLEVLKNIEKKLGRIKGIKWGPRIIDLDMLLYENKIIKRDNLTVPHPELHKRRFILAPLAEIAGGIVHPLKKKTILELYKKSPRAPKVIKLKKKDIYE